MCYNLHHKQYYIKNIPYSKEEYEYKKAEYLAGASLNTFRLFILNAVRKSYNIINGENCIGHNIFNSKDIHYGFSVYNATNVRYGQNILNLEDSADCVEAGMNSTHFYECHGVSNTCNAITTNASYYNTDVYYIHNCYNSHHLFGCIGLRHKEYCIFNKQYTERERNQLVPQLIEKMQER
ncbi:MAG: hypothetical protein LBG52_06415 [Candidatus Peribacteria bacterium]|jgi:hypothetical protein|nr:hypothetical protein [Candidatus Peribacteria bacterium]